MSIFNPRYSMPLIMITIIIVNYLIFVKNKNYLKINESFSKLPETKNSIFGYLVLLYVLFSIGSFFYGIFSVQPYN